MDEIKIYCSDNTESSEFEASSRGFRSDIYVKIADEIFIINVYDIVRLQQDFMTEMEAYGFFSIEPNIIIVKEVTLANIKKTVEKLFKQKFFENLKPVKKETLSLGKMIEI